MGHLPWYSCPLSPGFVGESATHHVSQWCRENLGTTLFAKRKLAFANGATKTE